MLTTFAEPLLKPEEDNPSDLLLQYDRDGYCIQENVFSEEECDQLVAAARKLEGYRKGITKPAMMPHRENPVFLDALKHPMIVSMIEKMVDGLASGLQTEFFYCKPGTRGFSNHQDNFFVQAPYGNFASAWIALTDTYSAKGGLIVWPGSHKEGLLPVRKISLAADAGQDPNANNEETVIPGYYSAHNASVGKGSVLYIHGHVVHGSNPNITDEWRSVLLNTYCKKGAPFRPGMYAQREAVDLYN